MDSYFNFKIADKGSLSQQCIAYGVTDYDSICNLIKGLPYGRNSDRSDFNLVLKEEKGTCATKHAFLKQLAIENKFEAISLYIGIYKMNASNTDGVSSVLNKNQLAFIPEAHTYLKYNETVLDFTSTNASTKFYDTLLYEVEIDPIQIGDYKVNLHQQFLKSWIEEDEIRYNFKDLWAIREQCILALSQ